MSARDAFVPAYHIVRPAPNNRWAVVHTLAGQLGHYAVDLECLTLQAAERQAAWLNAERTRALARERQENLLAGVLRA
jgi:hypothetical protein